MAELEQYLLFFAKFDNALSRAGFAKKGRKIDNGSNAKTWDADWDMFCDKLPETFFNVIKNDQETFSEIFKDGGPKIYGIEDNNKPQFYPDTPITDTKTLIYACKHIRNNLIHGEKCQIGKEDVQRNQKLLEEAEKILKKAMSVVDEIESHDKMETVFNDIPF